MFRKLFPAVFFLLTISICARQKDISYQTESNKLGNQKSVSEILNSDGTINTKVSGSFNAEGYNLSYGKNGEPILTKANNSQQTTSSVTWSTLGSGFGGGVSNTVKAIAVSPDGSSVYVGGGFNQLGDGTFAYYIAKYNTSSSTWSTLTSGSSNGVNNFVYAIAVSPDGSEVYVGGSFTQLGDGTSANYIAKWNNSSSTWSTLPSGSSNGVNKTVYTIVVSPDGSDVYVGGEFTQLGDGTSANNIVMWNTISSAWSTLPSGSSNGVDAYVNAIAINPDGSEVYLGGRFAHLGDGTSAYSIAKWNTLSSTWSTLPSGSSNGVNSIVNAIAISPDGSSVYVGGEFTQLGDGTSANYIAKWNTSSSTWSNLTSGSYNGLNKQVRTIAISPNGSEVYAGGYFTQLADGTSAIYIAKWNTISSTWSTLTDGTANGVSNLVNSLSINSVEGKMYVGGAFNKVGQSTYANYVAKFADADNPLPVELSSFIASVHENIVTLKWQTVTEVNNSGFEIQRRNTPLQFPTQEGNVQSGSDVWENVGFVKGSGTTNSPETYSFVDDNPLQGKAEYRLKQENNDGTFKYSSIVTVNLVPDKFELSQNYPNPFNPTTTIQYAIPQSEHVTLKVYDELGNLVSTLVNENKTAGTYKASFNGLNLSSGVYFYKITAGNYSAVKKLMLLK